MPDDRLGSLNWNEWGTLRSDATSANFRTVHLQRLANPLLDWDANTNPYRTVDTMSVDVTAFNGLSDITEPTHLGGEVQLRALERGDEKMVVAAPRPREIWRHQEPNTDADITNQAPAGTINFFDHELQHSLGFLNKDYLPAYNSTTAPNVDIDGNGVRDLAGVPRIVVPGDNTFPWLTWNNRPFVSQYELMQVPASSSSRMFYEFTRATTDDPYDSWTTGGTTEFDNFRAPYNHLLNFFQTARVPDQINIDEAAHFYRLFDYTHVPSRFVGTETVLNPTAFGLLVSQTENFRPPFNKVSTYREPGRVNINTITDTRIWEGGIIE